MNSTAFTLKSAAVAALLTASGVSQAAIDLYFSPADFNAVTSAPATDTFDDISNTGVTAGPLNRTVGAYSYTVTTTSGDFYGAGVGTDHWLAPNVATDTMTFSGLTGVTGLSGFFFGSDVSGAFATGQVQVTAYESPTSWTQITINDPRTDLYIGFVSSSAITSFTVTAIQPATGALWPTVNDLTFATAPVPEPETYALMFGGLGVIGLIARRRKL